MNNLFIATACLLNPQRELLLVRKRGSRFWMLPGGKIDGTETATQALQRELNEELQWDASTTVFQPLGSFENQAANEANTRVRAEVFYASLPQPPDVQIAAEIKAMQWWHLDAAMDDSFAPLLREMVVPALRRTLKVSAVSA